MPTPDASQFTQLRKYAASGAIAAQDQAQKRTVTRTTQPLPFVSNPGKFLSSFSNKSTSGTSFVHINRVTGIQAKTKVPGGHVFGDSSGRNTCGVINITDIATYDVGNLWYVLNGNYTITACQILNIPLAITLQINAGQTLTNNGTMNNDGTINNAGFLRNNGTFTINGNLNNIHYVYNTGTFTINGRLNNSLYVYNTGTLNNNATFNNNAPGNIFNNPPGVFNNTSILKNTGISYNDGGATINNSGFIYTYDGGTTSNDGTLNNTGTISTSSGGTCGPGALTNNGTINNTGSGTQNTDCPSRSGVPS